jgi:ribonuclease/clavin/mitogillin
MSEEKGAKERPQRAAACILWRRGSDDEIEIYLVQRAASLKFMGGYWAFPGGRVEGSDSTRVTALRELGEETGVELAPDTEMVAAGRWITPNCLPIVFDTDYFLIEAPGDARPDARRSGGELTAGRWVTPAAALARWRHADWLVAAPVARVLKVLDGGPGDASRCVAEAERANQVLVGTIAPGISVCPLRTPTLPPATHTNCYLIGTRELVIVDPGSPYPDEQHKLDAAVAQLCDRGGRVAAVWLTHHHRDHVAGAVALARRWSVPIACHPATAALLSGQVPVAASLEDGQRLVLAGDPPRRLRVIHTPGHAPGHCCFVEEHSGIVIAGDMVAAHGTIVIDPDDGDMRDYLASLRLLVGNAPRLLLPAHGGSIAAVQSTLAHYIEHRLWREGRVIDALAELGPGPAAGLVSRVYDDVPTALHKLAERSLLAHLVKLAAEGRVVEHERGWELTATA